MGDSGIVPVPYELPGSVAVLGGEFRHRPGAEPGGLAAGTPAELAGADADATIAAPVHVK